MMCVTVRASHPSDSMATEITFCRCLVGQRIEQRRVVSLGDEDDVDGLGTLTPLRAVPNLGPVLAGVVTPGQAKEVSKLARCNRLLLRERLGLPREPFALKSLTSQRRK
jgi:hypothetical protein